LFAKLPAFVLAVPPAGQDRVLRFGDRMLSFEEVQARTEGRTFTFFGGGALKFSAGGA
jgi:hypothetical protein